MRASSTGTWIQLHLLPDEEDRCLDALPLALSPTFSPEVIGIGLASSVGYISYSHVHEGREVRRLSYCGEWEERWRINRGTQESWETVPSRTESPGAHARLEALGKQFGIPGPLEPARSSAWSNERLILPNPLKLAWGWLQLWRATE
jgi:hypothetical protein